jgi:hypothetical protein
MILRILVITIKGADMPDQERSIVSITVDHTKETIDVECNDLDQWDSLMTCVLGLGLLYNRCLNQGYPEKKLHDAMMTSLFGAIEVFKSTGKDNKF